MATNYPINPRVRALGKARLDIARRAQTPADWERLWKAPAHDFPFTWGERWKQCVEYKVDDFAAEVGFYIDILGLSVNALDPDYAMFTSPQGDFFIAIIPVPVGPAEAFSTPPDALRLQFMVADIFATVEELESRGIAFEQQPQPVQPGSTLHIATFLTPHGICIDLWGVLPSLRPSLATAEEDNEDIFLPDDEEDDDLSLFTTQDVAPLRTPHSDSPSTPTRPSYRPPVPPLVASKVSLEDTSEGDLDEDLEDGLDDDLDFEDEIENEAEDDLTDDLDDDIEDDLTDDLDDDLEDELVNDLDDDLEDEFAENIEEDDDDYKDEDFDVV